MGVRVLTHVSVSVRVSVRVRVRVRVRVCFRETCLCVVCAKFIVEKAQCGKGDAPHLGACVHVLCVVWCVHVCCCVFVCNYRVFSINSLLFV